MPILIQPATPADLDTLLVLMRHMQNDDPWSEPFDETIVRKNLSRLIHNFHYGCIYLAREEQIPVAYLVICFDYSLEYRGKGAWIDERLVGIGTQLLNVAESASCESGAQFLHLEVNHGNSAIELYRRRGFVDHQRYLMTKPLKPV